MQDANEEPIGYGMNPADPDEEAELDDPELDEANEVDGIDGDEEDDLDEENEEDDDEAA